MKLHQPLRKIWAAGWCFAVSYFAMFATEAPPFGTPILEPGLRQLFLDDGIIGDLNRVNRVIHQPKNMRVIR